MDINKGDVVKLKSNGPAMTVENIDMDSRNEPRAWCSWFSGVAAEFSINRDSFPLSALKLLKNT